MATHVPLVVLGGGPGGYAAAFLAADLGMDVTVIDRDERLGGTCLLRGCIPSKALLHVGRVLAETRELGEWGVTFPKPVIDLAALRARKEKLIGTLAGGLATLARRRNVRVVRGQARFTGPGTLEISPVEPGGTSQTITYDHCILATGSRPTRIPAFDIGSPRVMDSTAALELEDVPESLLVVGGGYIGLEMGTVYSELGSRVSVVELTDGTMPACWWPWAGGPTPTASGSRIPVSRSIAVASSRSTPVNARAIPASWRSATCAVNRCSPTGPATRARSRWRRCTAKRRCSRLGPFQRSCSPTRKLPGQA